MRKIFRSRPNPASVLLPACVLLLALTAGGCDTAPSSAVDSEAISTQGSIQGSEESANPDSDTPTAAQPLEEPPALPDFSAAQLEQMVAPIALYPDPLLMQVLMAATYPAEVAEAAVWMKEHPGFTGQALDKAVAHQGWDVSVNSLLHATKALELMAADPDWTRDLGDAFLAQQDDVLNAVQVMRLKASDLGTLKTTAEQKVMIEPAPVASQPAPVDSQPPPTAGGDVAPPVQYVVEPPPRVVRIVPVQPQVIYVPVYNPIVVYGLPPAVFYYPTVYQYPIAQVGVVSFISFGAGFALGNMIWGDFDWYGHRCYARGYGGGYYGGYYNGRRGWNGGGYYDGRRGWNGGGSYNDNWRGDGYQGGFSQPEPWRHSPQHRRDITYRQSDVAATYAGRYRGDTRAERDTWQTGKGARPQPRGHAYGKEGVAPTPRGNARGIGGTQPSRDMRDASRPGTRDDNRLTTEPQPGGRTKSASRDRGMSDRDKSAGGERDGSDVRSGDKRSDRAASGDSRKDGRGSATRPNAGDSKSSASRDAADTRDRSSAKSRAGQPDKSKAQPQAQSEKNAPASKPTARIPYTSPKRPSDSPSGKSMSAPKEKTRGSSSPEAGGDRRYQSSPRPESSGRSGAQDRPSSSGREQPSNRSSSRPEKSYDQGSPSQRGGSSAPADRGGSYGGTQRAPSVSPPRGSSSPQRSAPAPAPQAEQPQRSAPPTGNSPSSRGGYGGSSPKGGRF